MRAAEPLLPRAAVPRGPGLADAGRMTRRATFALATATTLALGVTACTNEAAPPEDAASATASETAAEPVELPDSPAGEASAWLLAVLNGERDLSTEVVDERFAPGFIELVGSAEAVRDSFVAAVALGPFRAIGYEETPASAGTRLATADGEYVMTVTVDDAGLISAASVQPAPEIPEPAQSWDELTDRIDAIAAPTTVTVFDVSDGDLDEPVYQHGVLTGAQPSGSMVKLFVLLAVADAVAEGSLTWETPLTIGEDVRSLPSGVLQNEPDGAEVSVRDAAQGMIAISDNTATDLLIDAVGVDAVEARIADLAPDGADATTPMLTTRSLFEIGWGEGDLVEQWADADDDGRRALLEQVAGAPLTTTAAAVTVPVWDSGVDWFFSATDLARVHLALDQVASTESGAPVAEILTSNPGLDFGDGWDHVAFKGGSSIGVLGGSWVLRAADRTHVVIVHSATVDLVEIPGQAPAIYLAADAAALLAAQ